MTERTLTLRELNRATLARQMLLERAALPVPDAIERLVGLQAQAALPPYVGLWTRLRDFQRDDLAGLIEARRVVKATWIRATLHLCTAEDYLRLRGAVQPALDAAYESITKRRPRVRDFDAVLETTRQYLSEQPRTFAEISAMLADLRPDDDVGAMRYGARTHLPMVQVPVSSGWSYTGNPQFTLADSWLGQPIPDDNDFRTLALRYLAAFGPASVTDLQTWSGIGKLKAAVDALKPDLRIFRDEQGRELLDVPEGPLPDADSPVPERFLPEFDNLLLAHQKRTRVLADEHRSSVYLPGLRVAATFLVDGFVGGTWKIEKARGTATLEIAPFESLAARTRGALEEEGERLVRFVESGAKAFAVRFAD